MKVYTGEPQMGGSVDRVQPGRGVSALLSSRTPLATSATTRSIDCVWQLSAMLEIDYLKVDGAGTLLNMLKFDDFGAPFDMIRHFPVASLSSDFGYLTSQQYLSILIFGEILR